MNRTSKPTSTPRSPGRRRGSRPMPASVCGPSTTTHGPDRLSPRLTVGALGGAVVTAGTVISVVVLGAAQPAFAGWSASPTAATGTQASSADAACQAKLAANPPPNGPTVGSGWTAVTTDVRGPFTVVIFQDGTSAATCFTGPSFTVLVPEQCQRTRRRRAAKA